MALLPAPLIIGLVSDWSRKILIGDLVAGAKVEVFARDPGGAVQAIGSVQAPGAGEQLIDIAAPAAGATLWATQTLDADRGDGDPATGPVVTRFPGGSSAPPQLVSQLYEGSRALWIEGVYPGSTVRVEQNGAVLAEGHAAALAGILHRPIGVRLALGQHVGGDTPVAIVASDPNGVEIARRTQRPRAPRDDFEPMAHTRQLPEVLVDKGVAACSSGVLLSQVVDGAEVTLLVNGAERARALFDRPSLTFLLSAGDAVKEGDLVQAVQQMWSTAPSDPGAGQHVGPAPTPSQPGLIKCCAGARGLMLSNLDPDAVVHVRMATADGDAELAYPPQGAFEENGSRRIKLPAPLLAGSTLAVWQSRCDKIGPRSEQPVDVRPGDPPPPSVIPPLRGCDEYVYVDTASRPVRVHSANAAATAGGGWEAGAISDWVMGGTVRVYPPLAPGDKIRVVGLMCDEAPNWSPEDQAWTVDPGPDEAEAQQTAMQLALSLTPPPNPSPLLHQAPGPVFVIKGPRAHLLTLTGTAAPPFLGRAIPTADGEAMIDIARPLVADETLLLEWSQCARILLTKGNPSAVVQRVAAPQAPVIERPSDGQTDVALGPLPARAVDAGLYTVHRATGLTLHLMREGAAERQEVTSFAPFVDGALPIDQEGARFLVRAFAFNEAGQSPPAEVRVTSKAAPPPPVQKRIRATTTEVVDGDYGVITITVTGAGFVDVPSGQLKAKYMIMYSGGGINPVREETTDDLKTFTVDADGAFTASGTARVQYYFRLADGSAAPVNQGVMVWVELGGEVYRDNMLPTEQRDLERLP